jgi:cytochrome oxidase Cu insertion factor (SCO1/SenC/PrrC family)
MCGLFAVANGQPANSQTFTATSTSAGRIVEIERARALIPDVKVRTHDGKNVRLYSDLIKNKVVLLSFFYTNCTNICPLQGEVLAKVQAELGPRMPQDVALISISMNPDVDSPRALKHWARSFGVRKGWTLVSSNSAEMRKMIKDFTGNPPGRREAHYSIVFIGNDRSGSWVAANGTNSPAELIKLIKFVAGSESVSAEQEALEPGPHMFEVNGVHLWYRVAGRRTGVPVVFLHGGPGEGSQAFQAFGGPQLEKTQRLIYFDQRGAGHSDRPKDASHYSIPIMVDDIEQLRIHLGVPRIVLVGHSFGSQLALEYASKYSERTAALVLVAATPNLLRSFDLLCERLAKEDPTAYARATQDMKAGSMPRCNVQHAYEG